MMLGDRRSTDRRSADPPPPPLYMYDEGAARGFGLDRGGATATVSAAAVRSRRARAGDASMRALAFAAAAGLRAADAELCTASSDQFPHKIAPAHSAHWSAEYLSFTTVRLNVSAGDGSGRSESYLVSRCPPGTTDSSLNGSTSVPLGTASADDKVAIKDLPIVSMLEHIEKVTALVGLPDASMVASPSVRSHVAAAGVVSFGSPLNTTLAASLSPDAILVGYFDSPLYQWATFSWPTAAPVVTVNEVKEITPLGRAEWTKFVSVFVGAESKANQLFQDIESKYAAAKQLALSASSQPSVFSARWYSWNGVRTWYPPGGRSYVATMLADAGASYVLSSDTNTGSASLNESFGIATAAPAKFWVNPDAQWRTIDDAIGTATGPSDFSDPAFANFTSVRCGNVWERTLRQDPVSTANDALQTAIVLPHLLLKDLIKIFHPDLMLGHRFEFYENVLPVHTGNAHLVGACSHSSTWRWPGEYVDSAPITTGAGNTTVVVSNTGVRSLPSSSDDGMDGGAVAALVCAISLALMIIAGLVASIFAKRSSELKLRRRLLSMNAEEREVYLKDGPSSA
jgi:iron complex transport system substrate-binding protein